MPNAARPRLLVLGSRGQVGWELVRTLAPLGDVMALDRTVVDLEDKDAVRATLRSSAADVVVNAAAYTRVDLAENEPALAHRINADVPALLADEAERAGSLLVHFSTDYVFDGAATRPYTEDDPPSPNTVYGRSKLAGDEAVFSSRAAAYVFRIGWVYGRRGRNFLETIERQAREREVLRIVNDQHGSPTWSRVVAETTALAVARWLQSRRGKRDAPKTGLYHMAAPDHTTWHGFASAIVCALNFPQGRAQPAVAPISSTEYPTRAKRPMWSVLDSRRLRDEFGLALPPWQEQLALCMESDAARGIE